MATGRVAGIKSATMTFRSVSFLTDAVRLERLKM
jgi:hypothetical protein